MGKKYAVDIGGDVVIWRDGKFESESKELLEKINRVKEKTKKAKGYAIVLDGSVLYSFYDGQKWIDPEKAWVTSFAFLQTITGGDIKFISGDRPTWEILGYKLKDKEMP